MGVVEGLGLGLGLVLGGVGGGVGVVGVGLEADVPRHP